MEFFIKLYEITDYMKNSGFIDIDERPAFDYFGLDFFGFFPTRRSRRF